MILEILKKIGLCIILSMYVVLVSIVIIGGLVFFTGMIDFIIIIITVLVSFFAGYFLALSQVKRGLILKKFINHAKGDEQ